MKDERERIERVIDVVIARWFVSFMRYEEMERGRKVLGPGWAESFF
jgi:hypothetical protein